ncbi:MAG TPA: TetR/AcrR family transcriptional regulator [Verrucomicrobiae bacterium]|jgi:AcrR family transcriptional regulator|nr:TetR/AcrR family transcriptional regulator [Verrucomicrobiae bacterium]
MKAKSRRKPAAGKGPGRRSENKKKTRQAILRAALELFASQGFYRTTTKAISRKAGIAEGTLFNYFRTKEDLAVYFLEQELDAVIKWYENDDRIQKAALPEQLFAIIQRSLDRLAPYEEFVGAVYLRALVPSSSLGPWSLQTQSRSLRYLQFIREILATAEDDEQIPPLGDFGAYAFGLFHLAIATHWLQDRSRGKERTLALMDRCLNLGSHFLQKRNWNW